MWTKALFGRRHGLGTGLPTMAMGMVIFMGLGPTAAAAEEIGDDSSAEQLTWKHSTRDVYWNGELVPEIEVLSAEGSRWAVALPNQQGIYVLQPDENGESAVTAVPTETFEWSEDRLRATSPAIEPGDDAEVFDFPDGVWIREPAQGLAQGVQGGQGPGRHVLVTPHQGPSGPLTVDRLWHSVPVWRSAFDAYEPTAKAVDRLRTEDRELEFKVFFGTWCGDSRRSVPRLLSALGAADNPKLEVELVAIGRGFTEPMDDIRRFRVTNVPTVLVLQGSHEVGRFVERPHSDNIETDLAALLAGRPIPPKALFNEDDQLLASGRYGLFVDGKDGVGGNDSVGGNDGVGGNGGPDGGGAARVGEESWRLFKIADGGFRLHTRQLENGRRTDTWHRRTELGPTAFMEITRFVDGELSRTRASFGEHLATSTTRGSEGGILKQTAGLIGDRGDRALVSAPSVAGWGFLWAAAGRPEGRLETDAFVWSGAGSPTAGRMETLMLDGLGSGALGEQPCDRIAVGLGQRSGELCLHPELDLPVRASWGKSEARLEALEIEPKRPPAEVESP